MKTIGKTLLTAGILAAFLTSSRAETSVTTVTNVVTVLVTNVVTITNVAAAVPAPAASPAAPAKNPWQNTASAGLTLTRGNSQNMLFSADILTEKKTKENEYSFGAGVSYGNQSSPQTIVILGKSANITTSKDTVNAYTAFGQWNHLFTDTFFGYVRADVLRDTIASIDYRVNLGPGVGYYLIKKDATTLAFEAGAGFENEHLLNSAKAYQSFATVRLAERFEHKFNDRARLWQKVELLPDVGNFNNYVVNFEIGVEAAVSKSFSLKTYLDDTYNNVPATGRQKNDAKIVAGVSYKF
jgi:putative salt-induced outer membrane protein YdiY